MGLTAEQREAFEELEKVYGAAEVDLSDIRGFVDYDLYADRCVRAALSYYAYLKLAESTNFEEIVRLREEERLRKLRERSVEVRANIMYSIFTSMSSKINGSFPGAAVSMASNDTTLSLMCSTGKSNYVTVVYTKGSFVLQTSINDDTYVDDATTVQGSLAPRAQLTGIEALMTFIENAAKGGAEA